MPPRPGRTRAAAGFTVKSGWACAVLVAGDAASPAVADSRRIELGDPGVPEARQPYHEGFGTARAAGPPLSRLVASVERYGGRAVAGLFDAYRADGYALRGAAIVAGSLIDPDRIANDHIRIHALEGRLFRSIVEKAAERNGLRSLVCRERDLYVLAAERLHRSIEDLRAAVAGLGRGAAGPWRAEHKSAALAAWLLLGDRRYTRSAA